MNREGERVVGDSDWTSVSMCLGHSSTCLAVYVDEGRSVRCEGLDSPRQSTKVRREKQCSERRDEHADVQLDDPPAN